MKRPSLCSALVVWAIALAGISAQAEGPAVKVGFAERDITPDIGMEQPGGYGKVFHRTLHDPCKVRAVVFDDGQKRVALVGIDALIIMRPSVEKARRAIHEKCGIAPEAILIGASHSHSSGPTGMVLPGQFDHASPLVQKLAYQDSSCADAGYLRRVEEAIVAAVQQADSQRAEASCSIGKGLEDKAAFNRRFRMKNGLSFTHPGKGNPEIIESAGPIDPEVGVVGAWNKDGKLIGCVVNYACHATCNPGGISANWIYYLEQTIRGVFGPQVVVVFLQGACGDVTQVDNLDPRANPAPEEWSQLVGGRVGAEAVKVLFSSPRGSLTPVDYGVDTLRLARRVPKPELVREALELVQKNPKDVGHTEWTFAKETVLLDAILAKEPAKDVEIQAIQVGPAVFLTNPAEFFCQLGLDIKAKSPFPFTFPVELANDCVGYVPTEEAFGPNGGGYETRLTSYSNLEPAAGTKMAQKALDLAGRLKPGPIPSRPLVPPSSEPWSYGNLPPQVD